MRMNEDSIRRIDRSMPVEMEGQNRKNKVDNTCNPVNKTYASSRPSGAEDTIPWSVATAGAMPSTT